jgi:hypothetical protein
VVTVTISAAGEALVVVTSNDFNTNNGSGCYISFGTGTAATASDLTAEITTNQHFNASQSSAVFLVKGLTPGTVTFTAYYRADSGTCNFENRRMIVFPF